MPAWYAGCAVYALTPPPLPDQAVSDAYPAPLVFSVVPPTATTVAASAGALTPAPSSPVAARNVTPPERPAGVVSTASSDDPPAYSPAPKLIDTTDTAGFAAAVFAAWYRSSSVGPFASYRIRLAAGAIACAHCTSRAASSDQELLYGSSAGSGPVAPSWFST